MERLGCPPGQLNLNSRGGMQAAVTLSSSGNSELQTGSGTTVLTRCNRKGTALLSSSGETTWSLSVCHRDEHKGAGFTRGGGWPLAALPTHVEFQGEVRKTAMFPCLGPLWALSPALPLVRAPGAALCQPSRERPRLSQEPWPPSWYLQRASSSLY